MSLDPITIATVVAGASSVYNAYQGSKNSKAQQKEQNRRNNLAEQYVTPYLKQGDVGGVGQLNDFLAGLGNGPKMGEGFNIGQDALFQMLRADPSSKVHSTLEGMMGDGNPFDTSNVFSTLQALDKRKRADALGDLRSTAPGLGQRFGSAMMREEGDLVARLLDESSARDAQIAMGSHESAQNRILQATQMLSGRETADRESQSGIAQLLANLGIAEGNQNLQTDQLMLQGLAQLIGAQQGTKGQNLQALSLLLGQPMPQAGYNVGGDMMDFASLLAMMGMQKNQPTPPVTKP